ncbi:ABC transporter permease [Falsigemmobacter intermedius]|uniref:ABC transporter permease subunit n=1 Tax=Falsigemmobacter intermedius TaxID=1553448 RepID=A0A444M9S6_9RHOB|nr:ABC transporter permease subunit [Falsigemmobacter intermedius]RWY39905.1 ABC transporter permease subunit [Falsigemmobacter intermedius]
MAIPAGYRDMLLSGMFTTLTLALSALALALCLGLLVALARQSGGHIARTLAGTYATVMRGTPDIAMMLLLYFSLQIWLNMATDALGIGQIEISPFGAGAIVLGVIYGAYFSETFRGAFMAVPKGQIEAGLAYGLTRAACFRHILFPQMMRFALPGMANNWLVMVKATAVVSLVGLPDITRAAINAGKGSGQVMFYLLICAGFYLIVTALSTLLIAWLNRRYSVGVREVAL